MQIFTNVCRNNSLCCNFIYKKNPFYVAMQNANNGHIINYSLVRGKLVYLKACLDNVLKLSALSNKVLTFKVSWYLTF